MTEELQHQQQAPEEFIPWDADGMWRDRIISFNLDPISYINPQRLRNSPFEDLFSIDGLGEQMRLKLSGLLRQQLNLDKDFCFDFSPVERRIALLDIETIVKLEKLLGIVFYARQVKQKVERRSYEQVVEELGQDLYDFCIYRSLLFRVDNEAADKIKISSNWMSNCVAAGHLLLCNMLSHEPSAILKRFHLRFATTIDSKSTKGLSFLSKVVVPWATIRQLLVREIDPGLRQCLN